MEIVFPWTKYSLCPTWHGTVLGTQVKTRRYLNLRYVEVHSGRWIITYCLLVRPNKELYTLLSFSFRLNLFRFFYMTVTRLNMTCSMGPILHMALPILGINIQHKEREEDPTCIIGTTFLPFSYDMFFFGGTARGYSSKL